MKDNAFWFRHDLGARNDPKLVRMRRTIGMAGIGIFWCFVEVLREQKGMITVDSLEDIAYDLHIDTEDLRAVVFDFGLFKNDGTHIWSERASDEISEMKDKSSKAMAAAMKRWGKCPTMPSDADCDAPAQEEECECNANAMQTHSECNTEEKRREEIRRDKIRTEEIREEEIIDLDSFDTESVSETAEPSRPPQKTEIDYDAIGAMYNEVCTDLPKSRAITAAMKAKIRSRWAEMQRIGEPMAVLRQIFEKAQASAFMRGENDRKWTASFGWFFENGNNWVKTLEGRYDRSGSSQKRTTAGEESKFVNSIWKN